MKAPLRRDEIAALVDMLDDNVEDLVRKDNRFKELSLVATDYVGNPAAVVDVLTEHGELMQRPVLVRGTRAIIGRPKERVLEFVR